MDIPACSDCGKPFYAAQKYDGWCPFNVNVYCPRDYECGLQPKMDAATEAVGQSASKGDEDEPIDENRNLFDQD